MLAHKFMSNLWEGKKGLGFNVFWHVLNDPTQAAGRANPPEAPLLLKDFRVQSSYHLQAEAPEPKP